MGTELEGGVSGDLDARAGGGGEAKHLGEGRVRKFCIHELAHRSL